jgi:hypothetical protein
MDIRFVRMRELGLGSGNKIGVLRSGLIRSLHRSLSRKRIVGHFGFLI